MDLLTAILTCSLYTSDEPLVRAIAQSNSHGNAFSVIDAAAEVSDVEPPPDPKTLEQALVRVGDIASKEGHPRLGWMQIPPEWAAMFGRQLPEAFDPCVNVSIGTAMLSQFDYECSVEAAAIAARARVQPGKGRRASVNARTARQLCVVRKYGQAIGMPDFELITTLELRAQRPTSITRPSDAPILVASPIARAWGSDCILVPLQKAVLPDPPPAPAGGPGS